MASPNPQSTAQIAGHPLHPMLIPFPVAFLVATFVCDLIFWRTGNPAWSTASLWLLGAALIMAALAAWPHSRHGRTRGMAALAAIAGLTDFVIAVLLSLWNWYRRYDLGDAAVLPLGLLLSAIV